MYSSQAIYFSCCMTKAIKTSCISSESLFLCSFREVYLSKNRECWEGFIIGTRHGNYMHDKGGNRIA